MKILVTGGAGFIGSHIVEQLHQRAEVRVLDNLRSGHRRNLAGLRCEFIAGSILDREAVRRAVQNVDYVFHLAAMVSVPESMQKPVECNETNTTGTLIVLEEAARAGVKKLAFSSSAAIYGNNPTVPKVETMLPEPVSPYAVTKLDGEFYAAMFTRENRLATVSLRYFNVFGPRQDPRSQVCRRRAGVHRTGAEARAADDLRRRRTDAEFCAGADRRRREHFSGHAIGRHGCVQRRRRGSHHHQPTGGDPPRAGRLAFGNPPRRRAARRRETFARGHHPAARRRLSPGGKNSGCAAGYHPVFPNPGAAALNRLTLHMTFEKTR